jgi:DNA-binding LacI/PurR family transcriptional regulator
VSYVLNDTPNQVIPEATRQRVLDAAAVLGYTPSAAAKTLRSGRSDVVLGLLPDWPIGTSVGRLIEQLSAALARQGLTFVVHPLAGTDRAVTELWKAITPVAVVTFEPLPEADVATMRSAGIGVTVALFGIDAAGPDAFSLSDRRNGRLQAEHLATAGHRRLGYADPDDPRLEVFAAARRDGARQACAELGLPGPSRRTVALDAGAAAEAIEGWRSEGVTAVCAYNDEVALALLGGLRRLGLAAPADLAVIGVDDIPAAALAWPPLSTVRADLPALSGYLVEQILTGLAGRPAPQRPGPDIHAVLVRESS